MSFLRKLSVFFSNELDRNLHFLLDSDQDAYLQEENYYKFIEFLSEKIPRFSKTTSINSFLRSSQKQTAWPGALRHLMVMHKLIHDVGEECYPWLSTDSMRHFNKFKGHDNSLKTFVYKAMVSYYYNYLTKLSYNYDDYMVCFHPESNLQSKFFENNVVSPLSSLSKLQNILRYLIHIFSLFEASIVEFTPCLLVKQTTYFCLTDCYHFYTYINQVITTLMKEFFNLPTQEAIFLYELYSEHLIITRKIQAYYETLQTELSEFALLIPKFFNFDAAYNTKVELYIRNLRSNRPKLLKAQTLPASKVNNHDESFTSVQDMSRIIAECINKNNSDSFYRKTIFEAPRGLPNKKGSSKRRVFPQPVGGKMLSTMPTQIGSKLAGDKSIEVQNTCISNQFEPGQFMSQSQQQLGQSHYPLTQGNQSFLPDENTDQMLSISANTSILQAQRADQGVLF